MSDPRPADGRWNCLVLAGAVLTILAGGCERIVTTTPSHVPTAPEDRPAPVVTESTQPTEPVPLALEQGPAQPLESAPLLLEDDSAQPAESPPLLLEDGPASDGSSGPAADNSRCFVCHVNYMQEEIAVTHANAGLGCAHCHGASDAHIADESWASGGNGTAPDRMYTRDQINTACMACHPKEKIDVPQHTAVLTALDGPQVCTDCHGSHRLPQRRCKWK
jgi:hypothetical protein